jgi:hypothetical protein
LGIWLFLWFPWWYGHGNWDCLLGLLSNSVTCFVMVHGLLTVVQWLYSMVSLMYSRTLMEMTSLTNTHPFTGVGILLMLRFLMAVAHPSLVSER